MINFEEY